MIYSTTLTDKTQLSCPALGFNKAPPLFFYWPLFRSVKDSEVTWTWSPEGAIRNGLSPSLEILTPRGTFQSIAARKEKDVSGRATAKREWEELFLFIIYIIFIGGIFKTSFLLRRWGFSVPDRSHCWIHAHLSASRQISQGSPDEMQWQMSLKHMSWCLGPWRSVTERLRVPNRN